MVPCCQHSFCAACLKEALRRVAACPLCRKPARLASALPNRSLSALLSCARGGLSATALASAAVASDDSEPIPQPRPSSAARRERRRRGSGRPEPQPEDRRSVLHRVWKENEPRCVALHASLSVAFDGTRSRTLMSTHVCMHVCEKQMCACKPLRAMQCLHALIVCAHVYACIQAYLCTPAHAQRSKSACKHIRMQACKHECKLKCMHAHSHAFVPSCMHPCTCAFVRAFVRVRVCACVNAFMYELLG